MQWSLLFRDRNNRREGHLSAHRKASQAVQGGNSGPLAAPRMRPLFRGRLACCNTLTAIPFMHHTWQAGQKITAVESRERERATGEGPSTPSAVPLPRGTLATATGAASGAGRALVPN